VALSGPCEKELSLAGPGSRVVEGELEAPRVGELGPFHTRFGPADVTDDRIAALEAAQEDPPEKLYALKAHHIDTTGGSADAIDGGQ
jgi:hypothetical protein